MHFKALFTFILLLSYSGNNNTLSAQQQLSSENINRRQLVTDNPYRHIIDIPLPRGYERIAADSFAYYLRHTALKKDKTVYLFDGKLKNNQSAQFAVLDISTGNKDLQQCADAVMRLRAEYFFASKKFQQILFSDNNGKPYRFTPPYTKDRFSKYLQLVFGMCGSASLSKQMKTVRSFPNIMPGDVIIRGGFPGHAVLVMDVAVNAANERIYLLAQSYMPAQDIHVLVNPNDAGLSPWYKVNGDRLIQTPEYLFYSTELKGW